MLNRRLVTLDSMVLAVSVLILIFYSSFASAKDEVIALQSDSTRVDVARFSTGQLDNWERKSFKGDTQYKLETDQDQNTFLAAVSQATASAIGTRIAIDLKQTPYLNWRWKVDNQLTNIDETTRSGDDFAARIYLVKTDGFLGRKTKAVNYVWSSNQSRGSRWNNAFKPKNAKMIAVRGTEDSVGQWVSEKRNVVEDFQLLFGTSLESVDLLVIMTDTDNSGLSARAGYGDIFFSSQ